MSLSQKGALYEGRDAVINKLGEHPVRALDDLASQIQAIRQQGNYGRKGPLAAPHPVTAISVTPGNGFATIQLTHQDPPSGAQYIVEYSTTPNFQTPIRVVSSAQITSGNSISFQQYLKGQILYWRGTVKLPSSPIAEWTYFGGTASPTAVSF